MDNDFPGPMTMIKIDGSKIKKLREQQGLTQLYLATAVEVTTDTISRWENRRYPSIKKENGLKLAEALGAELDEILEQIDFKDTYTSVTQESLSEDSSPPAYTPKLSKFKSIWPILLLTSTLFCIIVAFAYYYFTDAVHFTFSAQRILPPHCTKGQPFPVLLRVDSDLSKPVAIILKETFPPGSIVHSTTPEINLSNIKNSQIKWLGKIQGKGVFAYLISMNDDVENPSEFKGTASIRDGSVSMIIGESSIKLGLHHWSDVNADNVISDKEILMVYDYYSDIPGLALNIDFIEEMWMGDGYLWDAKNSQYEILE